MTNRCIAFQWRWNRFPLPVQIIWRKNPKLPKKIFLREDKKNEGKKKGKEILRAKKRMKTCVKSTIWKFEPSFKISTVCLFACFFKWKIFTNQRRLKASSKTTNQVFIFHLRNLSHPKTTNDSRTKKWGCNWIFDRPKQIFRLFSRNVLAIQLWFPYEKFLTPCLRCWTSSHRITTPNWNLSSHQIFSNIKTFCAHLQQRDWGEKTQFLWFQSNRTLLGWQQKPQSEDLQRWNCELWLQNPKSELAKCSSQRHLHSHPAKNF